MERKRPLPLWERMEVRGGVFMAKLMMAYPFRHPAFSPQSSPPLYGRGSGLFNACVFIFAGFQPSLGILVKLENATAPIVHHNQTSIK